SASVIGLFTTNKLLIHLSQPPALYRDQSAVFKRFEVPVERLAAYAGLRVNLFACKPYAVIEFMVRVILAPGLQIGVKAGRLDSESVQQRVHTKNDIVYHGERVVSG
ncbi:hypothetical protein, partial [Paenibacillus sp. AR247]|uniref:hypothetical protein n=1 Tax=Paenibacillus sp. AR247 TaxID=1631599 RepID=UPI001C615DE1